MRKIRKVLVANRGEIAVRVLRGLRELGIRGAVVYSAADRRSLPVLLADEAYPIGPAPSRQSYLRAAAGVAPRPAAGRGGPGRAAAPPPPPPGPASPREPPASPRLCRDAGVTFIGPSPEAIAAMGSKVESRRLMMAAGVPVVPGGRDPL